MNNKKLYIHIGMPKTGSSAIQAFFALNPEILHKNNYSFPWHPGFGQAFQTSAGNATNLHHWILEGRFSEFENAINQIPEDNVILSSEVLFHTARLYPEKLSKALESFDFKIICYVRKIDDLVNSCVNQLVKNHNFKSYNDFKVLIDDHDYSTTILKLTEFIDVSKIDLRVYDRDSFKNSSIYSDILYAVDLNKKVTESAFTQPEKIVNPSLAPAAFELRRLLNLVDFDEYNSPEKYEINGFLAEYSVEHSTNTNFSILSRSDRGDITALYNNRMNKLYAIFPKVSFKEKASQSQYSVNDDELVNVLHFLSLKNYSYYTKLLEILENFNESDSGVQRLQKIASLLLIHAPVAIYERFSPVLFKPKFVVLPHNFSRLTHSYSKDLALGELAVSQKLISTGGDPYFSLKTISIDNFNDVLIQVSLSSSVESTAQLHYQTLEEPFFGNNKFNLHKVIEGYNVITFRLGANNLNGQFRLDPIMKKGELEIHSILFLQA